MLLNSRNSLGKDGQLNTVGDVVANVGSPMQVGCPALPRGDTDMLIKVSFSFPQLDLSRLIIVLCLFFLLDFNLFWLPGNTCLHRD